MLNDGIPEERKFILFAAEEIFKLIFKLYSNTYAEPKKRNQWAAEIQSKITPGYIDLKDYENTSNTLKDFESLFEKCKKIFFMFDTIPENKIKYDMNYYEIFDPPIIVGNK